MWFLIWYFIIEKPKISETNICRLGELKKMEWCLDVSPLCQGMLFLSNKAATKFIIDELKESVKIISKRQISRCPVSNAFFCSPKVLFCSFYF